MSIFLRGASYLEAGVKSITRKLDSTINLYRLSVLLQECTPPQRSLHIKPGRCLQSQHYLDCKQPKKCGHYPTTDLAMVLQRWYILVH